jgi:hypothetical protein
MSLNRLAPFASVGLAALLTGCAGAAVVKNLAPELPKADPRVATCMSVVDRSAQCTDEFLPMLVDLRVSNDVPKGIAEADATEGRDALLARARAEWAKDSVDPARTEMCNAMGPKMSDEDSAAWALCLSQSDCAGYVKCVQPLYERTLTSAK